MNDTPNTSGICTVWYINVYQTVHYAVTMANSRRNELLDATLAHVAENGLADFTLRSVAAEIGTSHRMLIHHFGSKAGLERAIVERTTEIMTTPLADTEQAAPEIGSRELIESTWASLSNPAAIPLMRLYFDFSSRATHGDELARQVVETIRDHWARTALAARSDEAEAEVLLGAAVTSAFLKGLLLDELSGATFADTSAAVERFIQLVESYRATVQSALP